MDFQERKAAQEALRASNNEKISGKMSSGSSRPVPVKRGYSDPIGRQERIAEGLARIALFTRQQLGFEVCTRHPAYTANGTPPELSCKQCCSIYIGWTKTNVKAEVTAKPKRKRRTKAEMKAAREQQDRIDSTMHDLQGVADANK